MKKSLLPTFCSVDRCENNSKTHPDMAFFKMPENERGDEWLRQTGLEHRKGRRVCEKHFADDQLLICGNNKTTLKKTAIPTKKLPSLCALDEVPTTSKSTPVYLVSKLTQTEDDDGLSENVTLTHDNIAIFHKLSDIILTEELATLLCARDCLKYKANQQQSSRDVMQFYFNLFKRSPLTYSLTQKMNDMPNKNTLIKEYIKPGTNVNDETMSVLKERIDKMSPREKNCSLLIKSVPVKANLCYNIKKDKIYGLEEINGIQNPKPAKTAIVVMIKGVFAIWKQLLGYILVSEDCNESVIMNWIDTILTNLFEIGLNVRTCVISLKEKHILRKKVSTDAPFFYHKDKKIYLIYDASDLLVSIRDTLQTHNFHFQNKVAKYKDIVTFYKVDQERTIQYAHLLTESHINPKREQKQDVDYAAQVLSKKVANGLGNYIHLGLIQDAAGIGTVEFITHVIDLFDTLNARKRIRNDDEDENERTKPFNKDKAQIVFLNNMMKYFMNLKVFNLKTGQDVTSTTKVIDAVLITIKTIILFSEDLKTEINSVLWLGNLQRKALDVRIQRLHASVKSRSKNLTALQFSTAFRRAFYLDLKKFLHGGACKPDMSNFLQEIKEIKKEMEHDTEFSYEQLAKVKGGRVTNNEELTQEDSKNSSESVKNIKRYEYNHIKVEQCHSLQYVCEFILTKVRRIHSQCSIFRKYIHDNKRALDACNKKWKPIIKGPLAVPCEHFTAYVQNMDKMFVDALTNKLKPRIGDSLCKEIEKIDYKVPCDCFPKELVMGLFIRIRIFYTIRINNTEYKENNLSHTNLLVKRLE